MLDNELMLRRELEAVPSEQLRTILQAEVGKETPDDDLVLTILHILENREPDDLTPGSPREEAAWKLFRKRVKARKKQPRILWRSLSSAAVLLLVVGLLLVIVPHEAEADNWWDRIARWTDDFFGFFRDEEEDTFNLEDYEFRTDNPGLQQVYEAVVELGVTEPVVPMWLPEGYELAEIMFHNMLDRELIVARFESPDKTITYQMSFLSADKSEQYLKDNTPIIVYELNNTAHNIMKNYEIWVVAWKKDNIECSIAVDCQESALYEIIDSIYAWRILE